MKRMRTIVGVALVLGLGAAIYGCGLLPLNEEEEEVYCPDYTPTGEEDRHRCDDHERCMTEQVYMYTREDLNEEGECMRFGSSEGPAGDFDFICRAKIPSDEDRDGERLREVLRGRYDESTGWEFFLSENYGAYEEYISFGNPEQCLEHVEDEDWLRVCQACVLIRE